MLQKWKRKGKRFRHVEKDGEETTELSVKIRAAKFRDLPMSLRILIVNLSLFLILCAVFFMAGAYLYAPQAAGRNYVEACLAGDWNSAYDVCQFPDSTFLSRKNYVNAMTWKAKQDGTDGQETPEIKSFFMRRKQNLETGENRIYTVRYTLKGMSAGRNIGDRRRGYRKMELQRVVRCAERQLRDGCRNHRPGGCLVLSGRRAGREKVFKRDGR